MATKLERTSFNVSTNLKVALNLKGAHPQLAEGQAVYDGAGNDQHLLIMPFPDGSFRSLNVTASGPSFDFIDPSDAALVRFYNERELAILIGLVPGVSESSGTYNGTQWSWIITYNGVQYSGTDASKPDAIAKAFIKVVNLLPVGLRFG